MFSYQPISFLCTPLEVASLCSDQGRLQHRVGQQLIGKNYKIVNYCRQLSEKPYELWLRRLHSLDDALHHGSVPDRHQGWAALSRIALGGLAEHIKERGQRLPLSPPLAVYQLSRRGPAWA